MPNENVVDVDGESLRCWVCDGILRPEMTIDLHTVSSVEVLLCLSGGHRWPGSEPSRPVIAA